MDILLKKKKFQNTVWNVIHIKYDVLKKKKFFFCSGFDKDPNTSKFELYANVGQLSLIGLYKVRGSVIILPVVGNGPANLTFGMC